jgi:hypothetical protein
MRRFAWVSVVLVSVLAAPAVAADVKFPFDNELRLDTAPRRGSKRIPVIQVSSNGNMEIDLWCVSGRGTAVFAESSITIVPTAMQDNKCSAEQLATDEGLLNDLTEVTSWKRDGEIVTLSGSKTFRFRMSTN